MRAAVGFPRTVADALDSQPGEMAGLRLLFSFCNELVRTWARSAVTDTPLLRLDQAPFYELMDEHNQIARGIIRMLTRHLRACATWPMYGCRLPLVPSRPLLRSRNRSAANRKLETGLAEDEGRTTALIRHPSSVIRLADSDRLLIGSS